MTKKGLCTSCVINLSACLGYSDICLSACDEIDGSWLDARPPKPPAMLCRRFFAFIGYEKFTSSAHDALARARPVGEAGVA
jgi:hypothetical protein